MGAEPPTSAAVAYEVTLGYEARQPPFLSSWPEGWAAVHSQRTGRMPLHPRGAEFQCWSLHLPPPPQPSNYLISLASSINIQGFVCVFKTWLSDGCPQILDPSSAPTPGARFGNLA